MITDTRHFYQNEFLNRLSGLMSEYREFGLAQHLIEPPLRLGGEPMWL